MIPSQRQSSAPRLYGVETPNPAILQKPAASVFFVPEPSLERYSPHFKSLLIITALMLVCFTAWLTLGQVEVRAVTTGRVLPGIGTQEIMVREEGMILDKFLVAEGEMVKEGQAVAVLRKPSWESRGQELQREQSLITPEIVRLEAELRNTQPEFWSEGMNPAAVQREKELFMKRQQDFAERTRQTQELVQQRQAQVNKLSVELSRGESYLKFLDTPPSVVVNLPGDPNSPEEIERSTSSKKEGARRELATMRRDFNNTREELIRAQNMLKTLPATREKEIQEELMRKYRQRDALRGELRSIGEASDKLVVRAKTDGIVRDQAALGQDETITPFEALMQIMPTAEGITVVSPLTETQARRIAANQPVMIQLRMLKVNSIARLTGTVQHVNKWPTAVPNQFRYEAIIVAHSDSALTDKGQTVRLSPGTSVDVNIAMGNESLLQHISRKTLRTNFFSEIKGLTSI